MKRRDLEKKLKDLGWWEAPGGTGRQPHDVWTNGTRKIPVPRHNEIKEGTAKGILKSAKRK